MEEILNYIETLMNGSFEAWEEDAVTGYLTACVSIKKFIEEILVYKPF